MIALRNGKERGNKREEEGESCSQAVLLASRKLLVSRGRHSQVPNCPQAVMLASIRYRRRDVKTLGSSHLFYSSLRSAELLCAGLASVRKYL